MKHQTAPRRKTTIWTLKWMEETKVKGLAEEGIVQAGGTEMKVTNQIPEAKAILQIACGI